jgi:probable HAF family extracellular repeat protein
MNHRLALAMLAGCAAARAQTITSIGVLPGGAWSSALAVSGGGVVAGRAGIAGADGRAIRWTAQGGLEDLDTLPGTHYSEGVAISGDGSIIVGDCQTQTGFSALRWVLSAMEDLGTLPGDTRASASGISADGTVIVGGSGARAFRLTASAGMQDLGFLPGGNYAIASAVSADGSTSVGTASTSDGVYHACRWSGDPMEDLGVLSGWVESRAFGVSADGAVVVGTCYDNGLERAFRWTAAGMQDLGVLPGAVYSGAYCVSGDGGTVVGYSEAAGASARATMWTSATGLVDLNTYFATRGVSLAGWTLNRANSVNDDGTVIVGVGLLNGQSRGWIVALPATGSCYANCDGSAIPPILSINDFICFAQRFAAGDPSANCDNSNTPPVLNVDDFVCFQQHFAAGCQ